MAEDLKDLKKINLEFENFIDSLDSKKFNINMINNAYRLAKKAHLFQSRGDGEPYISHPLEVAKLVYELGLDDIAIVSAILHDVVEDSDYSLLEIDKQFGPEVSYIVESLTKINSFDKLIDKAKNKVETLRKILLASAKDIRILIIKLCDRLHNIKTLHLLDSREKIERIATETLQIYVPIAQKMGVYLIKWELENYAFKNLRPEEFEQIESKFEHSIDERENYIKTAISSVEKLLVEYNLKNFKVLGRVKTHYSQYKKIKEKDISIDDIHLIYDIYAIRVIVNSVTECYTVLGIIHDKFQAFPDRLKDYISTPKFNGYQSLHTVIFSKELNVPIEIHIRTDSMHRLAEYGVAAHWRYKEVGSDKMFDKRLSWLKEIRDWEETGNTESKEFMNLLMCNFFEDEIFVFSPKNDVISLPEGSIALDFAYAIHTEIGDYAFQAKVNGKLVSLDFELKSGDIVEIITRKKISLSDRYISLVKTSKARIKLKSLLNLKYSSAKAAKKAKLEIPFDKLVENMVGVEEFKKIRKAGCCNIEFGDQLVGTYKNNKELVIHNASCYNGKHSVTKKIGISWKNQENSLVDLHLVVKDRYGLLIDILNLVSSYNLRMEKLNSKISKSGVSANISFSIPNGPYLDEFAKKLKAIEDIQSVRVYKSLFNNYYV